MKSENHIDALIEAARCAPAPAPSADLVSRVLADAAMLSRPLEEARSGDEVPSALAHFAGFISRLLRPIGGIGGGVALAACTAFGVFAGAGYADDILTIPVLDEVLAAVSDTTDSTTPFETLSLLMTEG